jgi:uncharacterized phosphosugar-binding protein
MTNVDIYISNIQRLIQTVISSQSDNIEQAAQALSKSILSDNWVYAFGTGHSHMLAEEVFYRAGGMVKLCPILCTELMLHESAVKSSSMERLSGYAKVILEDYPIQKGDVLFVFSNSGRNAVPVEMAIEAKRLGVTVVAITNINHSSASKSRHESGKRLFEVADIVIDNCGEEGDACIQTKNQKVSPTSTVIGSMLVNAIVARTAEIIEQSNPDKFEFYASSNTDSGEISNKKYLEKYKSVIKCL